jgi:hypothetical protein
MRDELRIEIDAMTEVTANNILTMLLRLTQVTAGSSGRRTRATAGWATTRQGPRARRPAQRRAQAGEQVVIFGLYQRELEECGRRYAGASAR